MMVIVNLLMMYRS